MGLSGAKGEVMEMAGLVHSSVRWPAITVGLARGTGLGHAFPNGFPAPKGAGLVASHGEAGAFKDGRPRVVLPMRRRGVVLTAGAAGPRAAHGVLCPDRDRGLF